MSQFMEFMQTLLIISSVCVCVGGGVRMEVCVFICVSVCVCMKNVCTDRQESPKTFAGVHGSVTDIHTSASHVR